MLAKTLERTIKKPGKKSKGLKFVHFVKKARKDKESVRKKRPVIKTNRLADESRSKTKNRIPSRESNHKQEARHSARSVVTSQAILLELMSTYSAKGREN